MTTYCLYVKHKLDYTKGMLCNRKHQHMPMYQQVRWCTLNKLEIRFTNTLQYIGIRCHMAKGS